MRILLARYLRSVAYALVAFGQIWVYIPPVAAPPVAAPPDDAPSGGPPPGHPERLCTDVPLSEAEVIWGRQLLGVPGADPHAG
ncbi:DUF6059 family protein [Streptomyces sp. NPDC048211]|uniref:DUF6059 family protein n=1 Tax=Streptomyces sp. NPDC048211 TaxID=3365516 RepID=UPI00371C973E